MLNFFDHPEHFSSSLSEKSKPTKFLMLASIRREHPADDVSAPCEPVQKSVKAKVEEMLLDGKDRDSPEVKQAVQDIDNSMADEKETCAKKYRSLRLQICRGSEMTLNFASEMNPIDE